MDDQKLPRFTLKESERVSVKKGMNRLKLMKVFTD